MRHAPDPVVVCETVPHCLQPLGQCYVHIGRYLHRLLDHHVQAGVSLAFAICGGFAVKSALARLDLLRAAE